MAQQDPYFAYKLHQAVLAHVSAHQHMALGHLQSGQAPRAVVII